MFAIAAAVFFFLAAFGVSLGSLNLVWFGLGLLALHFGYEIALPAVRTYHRD